MSKLDKRIKEFLELDENERNKDIVKGAVEWVKIKNSNLKNLEDIDIEYLLYCFSKLCYGTEKRLEDE